MQVMTVSYDIASYDAEQLNRFLSTHASLSILDLGAVRVPLYEVGSTMSNSFWMHILWVNAS